MAQEIVLPQWGMEMQDATIVRWLKQEGDSVQEGEPLVELETAKIATELESTASGVVAHILVPEGAIVPIRTVLAIVAAPGEQVQRPAGAAPSVTAPPAPGAESCSRMYKTSGWPRRSQRPTRPRWCLSRGCVSPLPRVCCRACSPWPRSPCPPRWTSPTP